MEVNWQEVRSEFPALAEWVFLNTATFGQLPKCAVEAVANHFARRDRLACADFMEWFDDADRIRESIATLIHCAASDIAFIPNSSTALSLLLGGLDWKPGDQIVTLEDEFPNQSYYAAHLRHRQVELLETPFAGFYQAITERTRVVALSTVSYSTGFRPPLEEIAAHLKARGVLLYVDGTQSVGALQFDVSSIRPDMLAVHGYKWLLAPNGAGFCYVSPELRERLEPNVIGWRSHKDWRRPEQLHHGEPVFSDSAEKYEGGMLAFAPIYAMGESVEMMLKIGPARIEQRVMDLACRTADALRQAGGEVVHCESPIVTARFERDASKLAAGLKEQWILVAARRGNLRVSPHFYNSEEDIERLAQGLRLATSDTVPTTL